MKRKMLLLSIFLVGILAISAVSAAENATDDIASASDDEDLISLENDQNLSNSDDSDVLKAQESNESPVLQSSLNDTVEVLSATNASVNSDAVLGAINPDSVSSEPVLKAKKIKTVKMKVKYKWTTKKIGKFKLKARLWKVTYMNQYVNYLDIILYKNGKQLKCGSYVSKYYYKENGKWKWWSKWRHGGVNHAYHRYININPIKVIKVKFKY